VTSADEGGADAAMLPPSDGSNKSVSLLMVVFNEGAPEANPDETAAAGFLSSSKDLIFTSAFSIRLSSN